jgi:hypothetical protein
MLDRLDASAAANATWDAHWPRAWLRHRASINPAAEHFSVAAPATVAEKIGAGFREAWAAARPSSKHHVDVVTRN